MGHQRMKGFDIKPFLKIACCVLLIIFVAVNAAAAEKNLADCARIHDDTARLKCFDELVKEQWPATGGETSSPALSRERVVTDKKTIPLTPRKKTKLFPLWNDIGTCDLPIMKGKIFCALAPSSLFFPACRI